MKEKRTKEEGGFLCILGMTFLKIRNDLCISDSDREIFTVELLSKSMKNMVSCDYKPPDDNWKNQCNYLQEILTNTTMENKLYFVTGNFNTNYLEFHRLEVQRLDNFPIPCSKEELLL